MANDLRRLKQRITMQATKAVPSSSIMRPSMRRLVMMLAATGILLTTAVSAKKSQHNRHHAVQELKRLVPPISPHQLGGESPDDDMYCRFLSVADWDPAKAAPKLEKDFEWRRKIKPRQVRPSHCPTLCRQSAWRVLMKPRTGVLGWGGGGDGGSCTGVQDHTKKKQKQLPLHPPHSCPPMQSWRYTRHGLPITLFECWRWRPDLASKDERVRHMTYHMEHCVRRMPNAKVQRLCVIMDMRGFQSWMLPYVKSAVDVLRNHYPGRAGAMCFINVPGYFRPVWKIISPWLDEEILGKTFFLPSKIDNVEKAIAWLDKKSLKVGAA